MMADYFQLLLQQAVALHQAGRLAEARTAYQEILLAQPRNPDALHLLGVIFYQAGDNRQAVSLIGQAIAVDPANPAQHQNIGLAFKGLGRDGEALASYDKAIALKPAYPDAWNNRGALLQQMGRLDEALTSYDKALHFAPGFVEAWNNRGAVLRDMKRLDEALASYDRALELQPGIAEAWKNRGAVLQDMRRLEEALASASKAIALQPGYADAYNNRGAALRDLKRLDEALADFDKAIALKPDHADAYINRAPILRDLGRLDDALASYGTALALKPDYEFLLGHYLQTKMMICDWDKLDENLDACVAGIKAGRKVTTPFPFLGLLDDPALQKKVAEIYSDAKCPPSPDFAAFSGHHGGKKIRIGYYSADFYNHATSFLMAELLESHDAGRFELIAFSFGPDENDEMRQRISAAFGEFIDVRGRSDKDIARLSRDRGIDIAVDLKGHTRDSRPGIFAEGCAPIQAHYLGYPGTMGVRYIDYVIADHTLIPVASQAAYTEKIVRLPHSYQANDRNRKISTRPFTRQEFGLPPDGFVFCCFNNNYKILPETFSCWMRILKAVDGSVLWLLEDNASAAENLREQAMAHGVDADRLVFTKRLPVDEHLARHALADLFVDTWPCNAHTTASDALWAGLPLLTLLGQSFASRVAGSLLNAVELPELITASRQDYETAAIELARDPVKLAALRTKLAHNRLSTPLFNGKLLARHLEAAYEAMQARRAASLAPDHIDIPS